MKSLFHVKNKATLLLVSAILMLCFVFMITACGTGPATKAVNSNQGQYALDFNDCPAGRSCLLTGSTAVYSTSIQSKPLTLEAWIKPNVTTSAAFLQHMESRGAALKFAGIGGNSTHVTPIFEIRRVVLTVGGGGATSSQSYTVSGAANIAVGTWSHIAGKLVNNVDAAAGTAHNAVHVAAGVACAGQDGNAANDTWHLDMYINGVLNACDDTYGNGTDPAVASAPADAPSSPAVSSSANVIIDEARIWITDGRTILDCMSQELGTSGTCKINDTLLSYLRFNEGEGHNVADAAGVFSTLGKEYGIGGNLFEAWNTGWTTDTPF